MWTRRNSRSCPGKPCAHLCAQGCAIHETRFPVCRTYHCGWRYLAGLSDDWRPDKSGVLVDFQSDDLPPHYPKRPGIRLTVFGPPETALKPAFLDYVARLVASDIPVILAVPGPPGFSQRAALERCAERGRGLGATWRGCSAHGRGLQVARLAQIQPGRTPACEARGSVNHRPKIGYSAAGKSAPLGAADAQCHRFRGFKEGSSQ